MYQRQFYSFAQSLRFSQKFVWVRSNLPFSDTFIKDYYYRWNWEMENGIKWRNLFRGWAKMMNPNRFNVYCLHCLLYILCLSFGFFARPLWFKDFFEFKITDWNWSWPNFLVIIGKFGMEKRLGCAMMERVQILSGSIFLLNLLNNNNWTISSSWITVN